MVGSTLRSAREKRGLTIKDIENETSIRSAYTDALEKGNYEALPSEVYVKGFIRNYAEFLNLNADNLVQEFREELHGFEPEVPAAPEKNEQPHSMFDTGSDFRERVEKSHHTQNILITIGIIIVAFVGSIYYFFGEDPDAKPAQKPAVTQKAKQETNKTQTAQTAQTAPAQTNKQQTGAQQANGKNANQPAANGVAAPGMSVPSTNGTVQVSVKFTNRCWALVEADGQVLFEGTAEPNKTVNWSGKDKVNVTLGNAGAAEVTFNGKSIGKLGKEGEVVERSFTKDKMEEIK
ncbi:MAG: DUF4115 domain-containing protein [Schwartzia sp.]|nr:DUF4115 domain-containing protein [Schwartzia sp. (in: firmicutes)]